MVILISNKIIVTTVGFHLKRTKNISMKKQARFMHAFHVCVDREWSAMTFAKSIAGAQSRSGLLKRR